MKNVFQQKNTSYAELQVTSNFSFLRGASFPEEYVASALALGISALALTDACSFAGIVRAYIAAKDQNIRFITGTALDLIFVHEKESYQFTVLVYPCSREQYGALCRLITLGKAKGGKDGHLLTLEDFLSLHAGWIIIAVPPRCEVHKEYEKTWKVFAQFLRALSSPFYLALTQRYTNYGKKDFTSTLALAKELAAPLVATNDVYYHCPERKTLQDVVTCIRNKTTIADAGYLLTQNEERCLKSPQEMTRLFKDYPEALQNTLVIAEQAAAFSLAQLRYSYPDEVCPPGMRAIDYLRELTLEGARERYPQGLPEKVLKILEEEFALIEDLQYEKYFLTCRDIVHFAKEKNILCQGRGAAANSAVCYCLGITSVNPEQIDVLFARFVSKERSEPPDIDIDFEHERREEVMQHVYKRFGRERAALTGGVITYRHRSAIRDVGKALGLSLEAVDALAKSMHRWTGCKISAQDIRDIGLDPGDRRIQHAFILAKELKGFPRHLTQHVGGFVISETPLCEIVPIVPSAMESRTIIEWDKDDIDALGLLKIDVLALGMLTAIRKALDYINTIHGEKLALHTIPDNDMEVYDMIGRADTIGVFQIESRAQMSMLVRLKPKCFYDLVIEVAIVRPGPVHGNMVHPYLKRRQGLEKITFPHKNVEDVLGRTLGVPLFQEQAMRLAIVLAGFSPGEAERFRRAMSSWKRNTGLITACQERMRVGMLESGCDPIFVENCLKQIEGFSEYGFPESHAASFARLVYASSWLKYHYPAEFAAALINSQPMGFYSPAQIVRDAQEHGVHILPIDINRSGWDCRIEQHEDSGKYVRLGMRLVKGLGEQDALKIEAAVRGQGPFRSIEALWKNLETGVRKDSLLALAHADAFHSLGLNQKEALWDIKALPQKLLPFDAQFSFAEEIDDLFADNPRQLSMFEDFAATGISLRAHPLEFLRDYLRQRKIYAASELRQFKNNPNAFVSVAGFGSIRQRPGTAKGVVFVTIEDETGTLNLIIRPKVFEQYSKIVISSTFIIAHGVLDFVGAERELPYVNVLRVESLDGEVLALKQGEGRQDEVLEGARILSYSY